MSPSDEELIAGYLSGEETLFAELVSRHLKTVYSFVYRFVGSQQEAEDIAQDTFLKIWKNLKKYKPETSKFKTWILRIARNTAIDYMRKKKAVPFSEFDTIEGQNMLIETVPDTEVLPDELFARAEESDELVRAMNELGPKHREVLALHYTSRFTFEQIGHTMGEPQNTVKSRHHRALIALRKILEGKAPKGNR